MARKYIPVSIERELSKLAKGCCEYCKCLEMYMPNDLNTEHIIPITLEGGNLLKNLAKACFKCNILKHTAITALDPITNQTVPLFHPRKDNWDDHFQWSKDLLKIEGISSTGRTTIILLQTNRQSLINLRSVLIGKGHPPI